MTNRALAYIVKDQDPLILDADDTVRRACEVMRARGTGSALVVDSTKRLSGIFTGRDVVRLLANNDEPAQARLAQAMTRHPVEISPTACAIDALRAMEDGGFRHLPVVADGRIYGVVSRRDFKGMELEAFVRQQEGRVPAGTLDRRLSEMIDHDKPITLDGSKSVQEACQLMCRRKRGYVLVVDGRQALKGIFTGRDAVRAIAEGRDAASTRLSSAMTKAPFSIAPACRAIEALRVMSDGGFRHLPVVEEGRILGVVSRGDFTGIEVDRLDEEEHLKECIW